LEYRSWKCVYNPETRKVLGVKIYAVFTRRYYAVHVLEYYPHPSCLILQFSVADNVNDFVIH